MLRVQQNRYRQLQEVSGEYAFACDPDNVGESEGWQHGLPDARPIAVPASWNEQYQELMDYTGTAWYERREFVPAAWTDQCVCLRVGAAHYLTRVWVNGVFVGEHEGGSLPFEFDITELIRCGEENLLIFSINADSQPDRLPPGNFPHAEWNSDWQGQYPANNYDFYPYGGIHRPVYLYCLSHRHVRNLRVLPTVDGESARLDFRITVNTPDVACVRVYLDTALQCELTGGACTLTGGFDVANPMLWDTDHPHLYDFRVEVEADGRIVDAYTLPVGLRTITVEGQQLLLNGRPVFLTGFGKHEEFMIHGKGLNLPVMIKDYNLLRWIGANSFRTSHYPYCEEMLDLADRLGILVIGESALVGLMQRNFSPASLEKCQAHLQEMIERDINHPSIIMWSVANEPLSNMPEADGFFKSLYDFTRALDPSRPITMATCIGLADDTAIRHFDVISLNKYYGWYTHPGQLDQAERDLEAELDAWNDTYQKPIFISEFGADAIPGMHADPPRQFSEEYQAEMVTRQYRLFRGKPYIIGAHVWAFADFKTSQIFMRVLLNHKGVFTRERQPKLAAHALRRLWTADDAAQCLTEAQAH